MFVLFAAIFPRFPNRLADVTALSDEENNTNLTRCVPVPPKIPRRPCQGFRKRQQNNLLQTADRQKLSYLIRGKCGCQCDCFGPFRSMPLLGQWLELRFQSSVQVVSTWVYSSVATFCTIVHQQARLHVREVGILDAPPLV